MAIKYYVCGDIIPRLNSPKIRKTLAAIENFMGVGDDDTVKAIKDLCAEIVDVDDVTRDKLKGGALVLDIKSKALAFRAANLPGSA